MRYAYQRPGRYRNMEKSLSQDESGEDIQSLQQKAGELDRYARNQLMQENILEAFAMFEKSSTLPDQIFSTISSYLV